MPDKIPSRIASIAGSEVSYNRHSIWYRWPFWIIILFFVWSLVRILLPMSLGHKPDYLAPFGVLFWTPALIAYILKDRERNIWLGLAVGIGFGFFILIFIQIVFATLWTTGYIQPPK